MKRVRWLNAEWPVSMRTLGARMKAQTFTPESFDGFVIGRIRESSIEARFVEKLISQETTTDPFGTQEIIDRVVYREVEFRLSTDFPHVEIINSQRSNKEFVSRLLELCNFSLTVTPIFIDLGDWVAAIQRQVASELVVDALQISELELEEGVSAKVLLKGNKDVRKAMVDLSAQKSFSLERMQITIPMEGRKVSLHLASAGAAKIPTDHFDDWLPILRRTMPRSPAKTSISAD